MQFLSRRHNKRSDEYGGSLENRARLVRELLEDMKEAIGDRCAVAIRFHVEEFLGPDGMTHDGEARDVIELLAELPDLWDVNLSDWPYDSGASRFFPEGYQRPYVEFVKSLTSKPVVGVGRFTSPDTMVTQIRKGVLDLIGAARPSIADPFLPKKIEEGRSEDIRECIGCNICASGENTSTPMRCTQNPTVGEEWRRGWHPEISPKKGSDDSVLIVGAGPSGLECAVTLGKRGYRVLLAESTQELGGRVTHERKLPGLSEWGRVADHRIQQLHKLANVEIYLESRLESGQVLEFGVPHVVIATGSIWRRDGTGRANLRSIPGWDNSNVHTPDDIMSGTKVDGPVVIFDDDHYYMGSVIAEVLRLQGNEVTFVTPAVEGSSWTRNTLEWMNIQRRFAELDIKVAAHQNLESLSPNSVTVASMITGELREIECAAVVLVTSRDALDQLYGSLVTSSASFSNAGIKSVERIGDCLSPGTIAAAVFEGHRYAQELDSPSNTDMPYRSERVLITS